jgi:hypothetical protein
MNDEEDRQRAFTTSKLLLGLCDRHFPLPVKPKTLMPAGDSEQDNWELVAPAFVFTGMSCLCSILALGQFRGLPRGGTQDASVLLRRLYEHAVTFAWIAADPDVHVRAWLASDYENRLKANRELRELGDAGLSAATEQKYKSYIAARPKIMGNVKTRTIEADRYWSAKIPLHGRKAPLPTTKLSFESLYTMIYRGASADAHATAGGISPWIHGTGGGSFVIAVKGGDNDDFPFTFAPIVFASWLFIVEHVLRWPAADEVTAAFAGWKSGGG